MPPKKKVCRLVEGRPGIARMHLEEKYSIIPSTPDSQLKNGHVLHLYLKFRNSRTETERHLLKAGYATFQGHSLNANIKKLVSQTVDKFRKLSDDREFAKFSSICDEVFSHLVYSPLISNTSNAPTCIPGQGDPSPEPDKEENTTAPPSRADVLTVEPIEDDKNLDVPIPVTPKAPLLPQQSPLSLSSSLSTRSQKELLTPRKQRLKRRLILVSESKAKLKHHLKGEIQGLKKKLITPKKIINQAIQRKISIIDGKNQTIRQLRRKLHGNALYMELVKTKCELDRLKNIHHKLLNKNKVKKRNENTVSIAKHGEVLEMVKEKDLAITELQNENLVLLESIDDINLEKDNENKGDAKADGKSYSSVTRLKVYDCIENKVPTANIPVLMKQFSKRFDFQEEDLPHRSTVELMARELGAISELQVAETLVSTDNVTLGFDATTEDGAHVNSIHFTTKEKCLTAAVDELAGGTGSDYAAHIIQTVDNLSAAYTYFNDANLQDTRNKMIDNIANTMTDRCAANAVAIREIGESWHKTLTQLNCHLHPLDTIASSVKSTLKKLETEKGSCYGQECIAANVVVKVNRIRYKDGKGDPRGFKSFLDKRQLPRGLIPRYRGNRLHIIFHICGIFIEYFTTFCEFFKLAGGPSLGGLRSVILQDFCNETAQTEFVVLGLLGKYLTGPWMTKFYTPATAELSHIEGIEVIRGVVVNLKESVESPADLLRSPVDFFGQELPANDTTLLKLRCFHVDKEHFVLMMRASLLAAINVLERQYSKHFSMDMTEELKKETASARSHNIDAEEIMGLFSALKQKAPNATLCFLSCRMRAIKNRTVEYLDSLDESRREAILKKAISYGRKQRDKRRKNQMQLREELIRRQDVKMQMKDAKIRRQVEKKLKEGGLDAVLKQFPTITISDTDRERVKELLEGGVIGRNIVHVWDLDGELLPYNGRIEKLLKRKRKGNLYKIAYWSEDQEYNDAQDTDVSIYAAATDFLLGELVLSD